MISDKYRTYQRRPDGSYRCESRVPGESRVLVRRKPDQPRAWETSLPFGTPLYGFVTARTRMDAISLHQHRMDEEMSDIPESERRWPHSA